jgi:hypothetical protein
MALDASPPASDTQEHEVICQVGQAWGLDRHAARDLADKALAAVPDPRDVVSMDDTCVVLLASLPCPTPVLTKIATRLVAVWSHVASGMLPWAALVHDFPMDLVDPTGTTRAQGVTFVCLMDARCMVFGCYLADGQPITEEMSIQRLGSTPHVGCEDEPEACPIDERRFDALVTEAALTALAEGRRPILLLRDVAEECDIDAPEIS